MFEFQIPTVVYIILNLSCNYGKKIKRKFPNFHEQQMGSIFLYQNVQCKNGQMDKWTDGQMTDSTKEEEHINSSQSA